MARVIEISTPLGKDLLLHGMQASESLGRLFEYSITLVSTKNDIDPDKLLGQPVTVKLELPDGGPRCFNARVTRFCMAGWLGRFVRYEMTARPWTWMLTRSTDCRIFQNQTVPDILKAIFEKYSNAAFEFDTRGNYLPWEYCVQYRETDFNFVSRLMEQEGLTYWFKHQDGKHTMVIADSPSACVACPGYAKVPYVAGERAGRIEKERVSDWRYAREVQPGAYAIDDFDFKKPSVDLMQTRAQSRGFAESGHEVFDAPGEFDSAGEGEAYVRVRLEELQAQHETAQAASNARGMLVGHTFALASHPRSDQNRNWLITAASLGVQASSHETTSADSGARFECNFTCIDAKTPFRTPRATPKPVVQGPQTAIVTGPAGDEIYTDEYGRVKVRFHWDRHGKNDENASCWVRVSHPWAGKNFGMVALPRIGQEVVIDFLEGDPDRPLITGRVYNGEQMPPWGLPANKTQTGVLTRSSKEGSPANANAIRFEDKKGSEQLWIHAEKNQDIEVESDETHWVGHDRKKTIDNDETTHVKHDRTETVDNNETITIGVNRSESVGSNETISIGIDRTETVGANESITIGSNRMITVGASETATVALQRTHSVGVNETIAIGAAQEVAIGAFQAITVGANQTTSVGKDQSNTIGGGQTTKVGKDRAVTVGGNLSTSVDKDESRKVTGGRSADVGKDDALKVAKNLVIDAGDSVSITTGSASITMKKDGTITIKGKDITLQGSGKINVKADGDVVIKGSKVGVN